MIMQDGFTFWNFLADVFVIFLFVIWIWLLIVIFGDLFRRKDCSGWGKAIWVIFLIFLPYLTAFIYLISQGHGMAERNLQAQEAAKEQLRSIAGFSVADELAKLETLKAEGTISEAEYTTLRSKLV